jgi:hypothetical protein
MNVAEARAFMQVLFDHTTPIRSFLSIKIGSRIAITRALYGIRAPISPITGSSSGTGKGQTRA